VLLAIEPAVAEARLARTRDKLESAGSAFHQRVHDGFLLQAMEDPDRWAVVDASGPEDEIAEQIWQVVQIRFPDVG
jgi:dTMP kinase